MLNVEHLSIHFEERGKREDAVKNVSFQLADGEILGIVGESGSGKSTLLNLVGGLDTPTSGDPDRPVDPQDITRANRMLYAAGGLALAAGLGLKALACRRRK